MSTPLPVGIWKLDPAATTVTARVNKLRLFTVSAAFQISNSTIAVALSDEGDLGGSVEVEVDAASFATGNQRRDDHVRSADFLDATSYPVLRFVGTGIEEVATGWRLLGELTVRDHSAPAEFHVFDIVATGDTATFEATAVLDRRELGVSKLPSLVIGDAVAVTVRAQATRQ